MKFSRNFPKRIKVGSVSPPPTLYPDNLIERIRKMRILEESLLSLLMQVLGFESEIVEPPDKKYGHIEEDGNWTGLIGMVQREEIDFALARLVMTHKRASTVDFSYPYSIMPVTFITDKPRYASNSTAVFQPFSFIMWGIIFLSLAVVFFISYASQTRKDRSSSMLLTYGVLLEKSIKLKFKKKGIKLLMLFWIIGAMFITMFYKAVLLSFLTIPVLTGVRDISELSNACENPSFKCAAFKGSNDYQELKAAKDESWKKIAQCLNKSNFFTHDVETVLSPNNYKKAFIGIRTFLTPFEKKFFLSKDSFFNNIGAIAVRKTFCCKETLDEIIHKIAATGILNKFILDDEFFMSLAVKDLEKEDSDHKIQLSLVDLAGAFMVLLSGLFLACTVFLLEILLGKKSKSNCKCKVF